MLWATPRRLPALRARPIRHREWHSPHDGIARGPTAAQSSRLLGRHQPVRCRIQPGVATARLRDQRYSTWFVAANPLWATTILAARRGLLPFCGGTGTSQRTKLAARRLYERKA